MSSWIVITVFTFQKNSAHLFVGLNLPPFGLWTVSAMFLEKKWVPNLIHLFDWNFLKVCTKWSGQKCFNWLLQLLQFTNCTQCMATLGRFNCKSIDHCELLPVDEWLERGVGGLLELPHQGKQHRLDVTINLQSDEAGDAWKGHFDQHRCMELLLTGVRHYENWGTWLSWFVQEPQYPLHTYGFPTSSPYDRLFAFPWYF